MSPGGDVPGSTVVFDEITVRDGKWRRLRVFHASGIPALSKSRQGK